MKYNNTQRNYKQIILKCFKKAPEKGRFMYFLKMVQFLSFKVSFFKRNRLKYSLLSRSLK